VPRYVAKFSVGSEVQVAPIEALEEFQRTCRYHHALQNERTVTLDPSPRWRRLVTTIAQVSRRSNSTIATRRAERCCHPEQPGIFVQTVLRESCLIPGDNWVAELVVSGIRRVVPERCWFHAKRYGWGWGPPSSCQGWLNPDTSVWDGGVPYIRPKHMTRPSQLTFELGPGLNAPQRMAGAK
jgi:hypothetical protein